jgi:MinD-like ATPase involved in chromosome partitioning or flagellar assembly/tetratricopeptide (TPR) repeat protein
MRTITFYSYKGGVGRTLTAANFAMYLSSLGLSTAVMDFDLEAPGIDSKFPGFQIPEGQPGVLNYILHYQQHKEPPKDIRSYSTLVSLGGTEKAAPLWILPAGPYLTASYYKDLNRLDWNSIFSSTDGVSFLQDIPSKVAEELHVDFLIIDSRTGITESSGLCTQVLADEVVMLSSLSSESIKATAHIKRLIERSGVASDLSKTIDVKIVVSRVPKPQKIDDFKERCSGLFEIDESKLFFLFSCPQLEMEEFLAIHERGRDEELTTGYVRLFYGLNIDIASEYIRADIERSTRDLLAMSPERAEKTILELVALYPHPDAFRKAIYFYRLIGSVEQMRRFCRKLLEFQPDDEEIQRILAQSYLEGSATERSGLAARYAWSAARSAALASGLPREYVRRRSPGEEAAQAVRAIEPLWSRQELTPAEALIYADLLEDAKQYVRSFEISSLLMSNEILPVSERTRAQAIAARTALYLGRREVARQLMEGIPPDKLGPTLGREALKVHEENGDLERAFSLAKVLVDLDPGFVEHLVDLGRKLNRMNEVDEIVGQSDVLKEMARDPSFRRELRSYGLLTDSYTQSR